MPGRARIIPDQHFGGRGGAVYQPDRGLAVGVLEQECPICRRRCNLRHRALASPGTRQLGTGAASYFSIDGGTTDLGNWNNFVTGNSGDLGDWGGTTPYTPDSYNDNSDSGVVNPVTQRDIRLMNVIGWDLVPSQPPAPYDFNADGASDILWQHTSGQAAVWLMNSTAPFNAPAVGSNPGPSWQVIGAADFNGDGDADILWQNTNGQAAIWLMNGTTPLSEVN